MVSAGKPIRRLFPGDKVPLGVKLVFTIWVFTLVPDHWQATTVSFLWFCNVALLTTFLALWMENSLLASMQALSIVWWQLLWVVDFLIHLITGYNTIGMANYMFDPKLSLYSRVLSIYHAWLPFLLLWLVWRLGYDRRALFAQTLFAWVIFLLSFALTKDMHGPAGNLNMIYGLSESEPQTWMAPGLWLVLLMVVWPASVYLPTHLVFRRLFRPPQT